MRPLPVLSLFSPSSLSFSPSSISSSSLSLLPSPVFFFLLSPSSDLPSALCFFLYLCPSTPSLSHTHPLPLLFSPPEGEVWALCALLQGRGESLEQLRPFLSPQSAPHPTHQTSLPSHLQLHHPARCSRGQRATHSAAHPFSILHSPPALGVMPAPQHKEPSVGPG